MHLDAVPSESVPSLAESHGVSFVERAVADLIVDSVPSHPSALHAANIFSPAKRDVDKLLVVDKTPSFPGTLVFVGTAALVTSSEVPSKAKSVSGTALFAVDRPTVCGDKA